MNERLITWREIRAKARLSANDFRRLRRGDEVPAEHLVERPMVFRINLDGLRSIPERSLFPEPSIPLDFSNKSEENNE